MSDNSRNNANPTDKVTEKFPGLAANKPKKSISVQRPVDSDEKTVTETGLDGTVVEVAEPNEVSTTSGDDNLLELPPSPVQRRNKRRRTILLSVIVAVVLAIGGWAVLFFSPVLAIEDISYEGLDLVTESNAQERTAALQGKPLPQVTDRSVTKLFESNPAVEDITLRAEPPHGLVVTVNEYQPIAMSPRDKEYVVFSDDGTELATITSKKAQEFDLPVVASAADVEDEDVFQTITEVLGSLPDNIRDNVRAASGSSIDSIELELNSGKTVMWGSNDETAKKVKVLEALLGIDEDKAADISEYDVSAPDFPVTR